MRTVLWRIALIVGGAFLLLANSLGGEDGTFLALYPPASAERIGFDVAKLAVAALALWLIYRGIRPKRRPEISD